MNLKVGQRCPQRAGRRAEDLKRCLPMNRGAVRTPRPTSLALAM
jgi:hypothetical protein